MIRNPLQLAASAGAALAVLAASSAAAQEPDLETRLVAINASLEGVWEGQVVRIDPATGTANIYQDVIALEVISPDGLDFAYERGGQRVLYDHLEDGLHQVKAWSGERLIADVPVRFLDVVGPDAAGSWSHAEEYVFAAPDGTETEHRNEYAFENGVWSSSQYERPAGAETEFALAGSASYARAD